MFNKQANGETVPCCIATQDGVSFNSMNNAARINAGIEVIDVFSKKLGVSVPLFIDNAEGIQELFPIESQLISTAAR